MNLDILNEAIKVGTDKEITKEIYCPKCGMIEPMSILPAYYCMDCRVQLEVRAKPIKESENDE